MSWTFTSGTTVITLPIAPTDCIIKQPAMVTDIAIPTTSPFVIGIGKQLETIILRGVFADDTKTVSQIVTDYVNLFKDMVFKVVTISGSNICDGDWILKNFEATIKTVVVEYNMELIKGSAILSLG